MRGTVVGGVGEGEWAKGKEDDLAACFPALPFPSLTMDNSSTPRGVKREQEETGTSATSAAGTTTTTTTSTGDGMWGRRGDGGDAR